MQGSRFSFYGQIKEDRPLELEPIIVEIANAKQSQGEPIKTVRDLFYSQCEGLDDETLS